MKHRTLIYEKSAPGRQGYTLPQCRSGESDILAGLPAEFQRHDDAALPEVTEGEAMRHFVGLSVKNHHLDKGFYPLGSCTMKYNPKINESLVRSDRFTLANPHGPDG